MIEDDLRGIITGSMDVPVYSRLIPTALPDCIMVAYAGGRAVKSGIRKARYLVTLYSVSPDRPTASARLRQARDALITALPSTTAAGVHYYYATAINEGGLKRKTSAGPVYLEYVDMEVMASL